MERLFNNTDIKNVFLKVAHQTGEGSYFEFAISYDFRYFHLWVNSTYYGAAYEIHDMKISEESANKMFDLVFPISKWEIERPTTSMIDGNYFMLSYKHDCDVLLASSSYNHTAVYEMISVLINECL